MRFQQYLYEGISMEPTQEMKDFFKQRTDKHISYVNTNCQKLANIHPDIKSELLKRGYIHDESKYGQSEYVPYVWLTWKYKIEGEGKKFKYPSKEIEKVVDSAWKIHSQSNSHHPEYHNNPNDMTTVDLAEMVCDWHGMSMELGGTTKEWADKTVGKKWKFDDKNKDIIYGFIDNLDKIDKQ